MNPLLNLLGTWKSQQCVFQRQTQLRRGELITLTNYGIWLPSLYDIEHLSSSRNCQLKGAEKYDVAVYPWNAAAGVSFTALAS